ncbi:hypothetical protein Pmani_037145 [Petrolisthes manimaculis]|uniref:Uncharacterized protein n=1 Tax=Petrolisthes manimaculis TaxID=1843537 RepID=A0AAE1NIA4_9EUCA|nr:hypothetical protein Pmani_037145 [Petrolisthes manimaculis]
MELQPLPETPRNTYQGIFRPSIKGYDCVAVLKVSGGTTTSPPEPSAAVTTTATLWALAAHFRTQTKGDIIEEEEQGRSWTSQRGMAVFTSTVAGRPRINLS